MDSLGKDLNYFGGLVVALGHILTLESPAPFSSIVMLFWNNYKY